MAIGRCAALGAALHAAAAAGAGQACPFTEKGGWAAHQLRVVSAPAHSVINASTPGASRAENYYGLEGGAAVKVDGEYHIFVSEFYAAPRFVPSHLAVWSAPAPAGPWRRAATLFTSSGVVETAACTDPRGSLGSSVSPVFDEAAGRWEVFYSGFYACCPANETVHHFYNRRARQYRAVSSGGVAGPYVDAGVVLAPEDAGAQAWEGLMGVDSMSPPYRGGDGAWYAFYGSARTEVGTGESQRCAPTASNNNTIQERVGLATAPRLAGPWRRLATGNPVSLELPNTHTEQPIVTRFDDGTYGAVFDALDHETEGSVGYAWSPDGVRWHPACGSRIPVNGRWGQARTPQGLVAEGGGAFTLFFTGYDVPAEAPGGPHESLGYARVAFA